MNDSIDNPSPTMQAAIERNRKRQIELKAKYDRYVAKQKAKFDAPGCRIIFMQIPTYGVWLREIHRGKT